jgi:hypothetical protein
MLAAPKSMREPDGDAGQHQQRPTSTLRNIAELETW